MMKKILLLSLVLLVCVPLAAQESAAGGRTMVPLDDGWRFHFGNAADPVQDFGCGTEYFNYLTKAASIHNTGPYALDFDDSDWQEVHIPHDWVAALPYDAAASHSHGYKTVGYNYPTTSVGWYRLRLPLPASDLGKHLVVRFDGIFRNAQVWCNGIFMGGEASGYATQLYDITEYANYGGENILCVRADATMEEGWFYEGAGIYRDVWLIKEAPQHIPQFGTFAYTTLSADHTLATITVDTEVENAALTAATVTLRTTLRDDKGTVVAAAADTLAAVAAKDKTLLRGIHLILASPHLWDIDDPYLYTLLTEVVVDGTVVDAYPTRIGVRSIAFTADEGFFLNGKNIKLHGVNMHQDHAGVGTALPAALMRWRIKQLKAIGCNAYRSAHNPMSPALLDICDEEGLLVIDENRLMGINDYHTHLLENMIRRDRNHPSIILWSAGNEEWGLEKSIVGTRIAQAMTKIIQRLDPTRSTTIANAGGDELIKGLDIVGYNYIIQNDVLQRRAAYPQWRIVGTEETSGSGTRAVYFNTDSCRMASLNRIPLDSLWQVDYSPDAARHTPDVYSQGIERGWHFYHTTPWAAGCFFWTGFDYRGEPNPLTYPSHDSEYGVLDYCGFWKDEAYYLRAAWTAAATLHILPHWNLAGHEGEDIDLWVYSNCDAVALTVNGRALGRQRMPVDGHASWTVPYAAGKVVATGYNGGKKVMEEVVETTGAAAALRGGTDRATLVADGHDVAVVSIALTDKKGRVVPDGAAALHFRLTGAGRIIGAGNGDPACMAPDNPNEAECKEFSFPAFNGYAQLLVQATKTAGDIHLTCTADGLQPCEVDITTLPEPERWR